MAKIIHSPQTRPQKVKLPATPHRSTPRPTPVAVLGVVEVTKAVEEYVKSRRPDLYAQIQAHGIRMSESGQFVWELHGERRTGVERVEVTLLAS